MFNQTSTGVLDKLSILLIFSAFISLLYYWDPTRTYLKRWQESDPYIFEKVDPAFSNFDVTKHLSIFEPSDVLNIRVKLNDIIWGKNKLNRVPDEVIYHRFESSQIDEKCVDKTFTKTLRQLSCELHIYKNWKNLISVQELKLVIDGKYTASIGYFLPEVSNGVLILYHHGYAGTYHDQHKMLQRLNAQGYTIAALNHAAYGDNACPSKDDKYCHVAWGKFNINKPMRVHFSPIDAVINYALKNEQLKHVAMIGFSAGAWVTAIAAALIPRIDLSVLIAGVMPIPLRRGNEWPSAQRYKPLVKAASFLDLFIMATDTPKRTQFHIFNQFDRCCYSGLRPTLYDKALRYHISKTTGGHLEVLIDSSHPRHKISSYAFENILVWLNFSFNLNERHEPLGLFH